MLQIQIDPQISHHIRAGDGIHSLGTDLMISSVCIAVMSLSSWIDTLLWSRSSFRIT